MADWQSALILLLVMAAPFVLIGALIFFLTVTIGRETGSPRK
jgi:hypothetical protein